MFNKLELRVLTSLIGLSLLTQACLGMQPNPQTLQNSSLTPIVTDNNITKFPLVNLTPTPKLAAFYNPTPLSGRENNFFGSETENGLKIQEFKIYIDPLLVPDLEFAKENLPKYVYDMNFILAKNTNRRLRFNPETDIILASEKPQSDSCSNCPNDVYEIWSYITPREDINYPYSYGGQASFDDSGAGVLDGLHWTKIYNPETLIPNSDETSDYWIQIDHMLHEFAHVHGAGIGEYNNLVMVKDNTGIEPKADINLYDPNDFFWSNKKDFYADPLLINSYNNALIGNPTSRNDLLAKTKFSNLTAQIINVNYPMVPPIVDLSNLNIQLFDKSTNLPISDTNVKIWLVRGISDNPIKLINDGFSNDKGGFSFMWGTPGDPHNNYDFLRLVKVYKKGYKPLAFYISVFDLEIEKLLKNQDRYSTTVLMEPVQ